MRDLAFVGFILALLTLGFRRPFLFTLAYVYIDTVSPQRLSYYLLNGLPISMIVACLAMAAWLLFDRKTGFKITVRQSLLLALVAYAGITTMHAAVPLAAVEKWEWAWKALAFAIFLPFTLRTKLRIEAVILFLVLSCAAIVIVGGIKTLLSGGGYGVLNLLVDNNSGLYESSTSAAVAVAIIPLILWLAKFGTIFPPDWRTKVFAGALIFACLLMPVGTEARTGFVCIAVLALLMLRDVKRRLVYIAGAALLGMAALPFLPTTFTSRMSTIQSYQADDSATTRLAVWAWTWDYARQHPLGGGFGVYQQNRIMVQTVESRMAGGVQVVTARTAEDQGRAYHSAFFEMLAEQGFPGLILFVLIHGAGLVRMEIIRRRYRRASEEMAWIAPLATALQHFHIVYLVGAMFVAIAYQPFVYHVLAVQIGFDVWLRRTYGLKSGSRFGSKLAPAATAPQAA